MVTECTDRLNSLVQSFQQLVTECTHRVLATQPVLNSLLYISWLQNLPASSWPLLISSLFTGLRLMTGLIVCSSRQEIFSYTETASTGYTAHQPVTSYTVFMSSFTSHQVVSETTDLLSGAITVLPLLQRTGIDQQTHLVIT